MAVAHSCQLPLTHEQAGMLCEQADERRDGWINMHALLAMRSVTLFFDRLQAHASQSAPIVPPLHLGSMGVPPQPVCSVDLVVVSSW